jgi:hypothetical protein
MHEKQVFLTIFIIKNIRLQQFYQQSSLKLLGLILHNIFEEHGFRFGFQLNSKFEDKFSQ